VTVSLPMPVPVVVSTTLTGWPGAVAANCEPGIVAIGSLDIRRAISTFACGTGRYQKNFMSILRKNLYSTRLRPQYGKINMCGLF